MHQLANKMKDNLSQEETRRTRYIFLPKINNISSHLGKLGFEGRVGTCGSCLRTWDSTARAVKGRFWRTGRSADADAAITAVPESWLFGLVLLAGTAMLLLSMFLATAEGGGARGMTGPSMVNLPRGLMGGQGRWGLRAWFSRRVFSWRLSGVSWGSSGSSFFLLSAVRPSILRASMIPSWSSPDGGSRTLPNTLGGVGGGGRSVIK